jgi:hypothetical protein
LDGGTTFHFITEGFDAAYSAVLEAAGDNGVDIAGGASTVLQALTAGVPGRPARTCRWKSIRSPSTTVQRSTCRSSTRRR